MTSYSHGIQSDINYISAYLFETVEEAPADPTELIQEESEWEKLPAAPPKVAAYRDADIQGVACWNCAHFTIVGDPDNDNDLDGICNLWESQADAEKTCDRFTAHADLNRQGPHTSWQEDMANMKQDAMGPSVMEADYSDSAVMNQIQFASGEAEESDGLVWKNILRTGVWKQTPTGKGILNRPLKIVRDGLSDAKEGILALAEVLTNFDENAVQYVTVPLSDDEEDHKNIARLNTGIVKKLKIVDDNNVSYLRAGIDFTEPDVKEKVLSGTIPDVSAGIPFGVTRRSDSKTFGAVLDHVCLTRKPFVSDLGPFSIAAADGDDLPIEAWEQEEVDSVPPSPVPEAESPPPPISENESKPVSLTHRELESSIVRALSNQLRLSPEYRVDDVDGTIVTISHRTSNSSWRVPFRITSDSENPVVIAGVDKWKLIEEEHTQQPVAASDPLSQARKLRELRLSQPNSAGGTNNMSVLSLDGVELSDLSDEARTRIQSIVEENQRLSRENRESEVDRRINELKVLFGDRPGALKYYRQVMLDDDGGVAMVMFSDKPESERKRVTVIQVLDEFINTLKVNDQVNFSDQHFESGNDNRPPNDASGEKKAPLEERVEKVHTALYGDRNKRRTGRK